MKMSQQKFASNVVEKCLTFGSADERQILVNEMLGTSDENEPLQVYPLFASLLVFSVYPFLEIDLLLKIFLHITGLLSLVLVSTYETNA